MPNRNAFTDMMRNGQQSAKKTTSGGGWPTHEFWTGFEAVTLDGKRQAKCNKCKTVLANTAATRMQNHRWAPFRSPNCIL